MSKTEASKSAALLTISHDGDVWRILSQGAAKDGKVFCHLASTTRFRQQRNGANPVQMCDWIDSTAIEATGSAA